MSDPLNAWPAFASRVRERLEAGREAYGDRSFHAEPDVLLGELQQEALDLAGWGFVLFERIERAREALRSAHDSGAGSPVRSSKPTALTRSLGDYCPAPEKP